MKHFWVAVLSLALLIGAATPPLLAAALLCAPAGGRRSAEGAPASASTCCCPPGSGSPCQNDSGRHSGPPADCCGIAPAPRADQVVVPAAAPKPSLSRDHRPTEIGWVLSSSTAPFLPDSFFSDSASPPHVGTGSRRAFLSILLI